LDLTGDDLIEVSSGVKSDEGEEEDDEGNIAGDGFIRIEDMILCHDLRLEISL
jgi:hypothetical protein